MSENQLARPSLAILDVGHGNSAVLADTGGSIVVDAGLGPGLTSFLEQEQISTIDVVLLSHVHADHIGGLLHLISTRMFRIGLVRMNSNAMRGTELWKDLQYELDDLQSVGQLKFEPSLVRESGETFDRSEIHIEILGPSSSLAAAGIGGKDSEGRRITIHSLSAVVRLSKGNQSAAFFPGDLDEVGLDDLIRSGVDAKAPILIYPHHGGLSGSADEAIFVEKLCKLVQPTTVVFSIGRGRHGNPRPEVVEVVRRSLPGVRIACTQLSGHCSASLPKQDASHLTPHFAIGRHLRHCCGGTMLVSFDTPSPSLLPMLEEHSHFIADNAPTALCVRSSACS